MPSRDSSRILGLDTSSVACGWAVVEGADGRPARLLESGVLRFKAKGKNAKPHVERQLELMALVQETASFYGVDETAIEALKSVRNATIVRTLCGYINAASFGCYRALSKEPLILAQNTIHARIGVRVMTPAEKKGMKSKEITEENKRRVLIKINETFHLTLEDPDEGDAIAVALAGLAGP